MYSKILVPVDGSAPSAKGLAEAAELAKSCEAGLRLVHVVHVPVLGASAESATYYDQALEAMREEGRRVLGQAESFVRHRGLKAEAILLDAPGEVAELILEQARQWSADLIVMGTHGRRGLRRLVMGSDAEMVLRSSAVPVLLVRGEELRTRE